LAVAELIMKMKIQIQRFMNEKYEDEVDKKKCRIN